MEDREEAAARTRYREAAAAYGRAAASPVSTWADKWAPAAQAAEAARQLRDHWAEQVREWDARILEHTPDDP